MPSALAVFHDSLYVAGSYQIAGPDSVGAFGKWIGGGHIEDCGAIDAIPDFGNGPEIIVSPNPASDHIALDSSTQREIIVRDGLGRIVWRGISRGRMILDVTRWPTGLYTVVHGQSAIKLVIAR
ncbi:MAG: T9SS type A sorting domain-containing protein [Flavobacteriales bacterium]|nr:T9SS type A sorting domain-containing protein [Flavobacteriales bacterium]